MSARQTPISLVRMAPATLLRLYADVMSELRRRGVVRSSNNPVADLAETLGAAAFRLKLQGKSTAGYDGVSSDRVRYQIKARRVTPENSSTQLSPIRDLGAKKFDYLLAILFDQQFRVAGAYRIKPSVVRKHARFSAHVNGHLLVLRDDVLRHRDVEDVTARVRKAMRTLKQKGAERS